jgi:type II secretory ATPase GspE/PulE/Tfp pilus assembly ATPase PilB-like protein
MALADPTNVPAFSLSLAAEGGLFLISFWKPLVFLPFICAWGWVISNVYDKHAARFFLPRENWNLAHLCAGAVAILGGFGLPLLLNIEGAAGFIVGLLLTIVILATDIAVYAWAVKRDDRVPEQFKIGFNIGARMAASKAAKQAAKSAAAVRLAIRGSDKAIIAAPAQETPEFEIRIAAEEVYLKAMTNRASQLDFNPTGKDNSYAASVLVDGVRTSLSTLPAQQAVKVMDFWRAAGKMDIADRRKKQVRDIVVEQGTVKRTVRMTSIGTQGGMRLSMLFDPVAAVLRKPEELGLLDSQMAELKRMVDDPKMGVVLVAGLPDGGRTTVMYTLLGMHDAYTGQVTTAEMEPQAPLEGIKANSFEEMAEGSDFSTMVRSILRRDPNALGIAECPDANTAKEVAKAEGERVRLYLCMKADDSMKAVEQYFQLVGDNALAAKHLRGVIAHRLVRKLCSNCRAPVQPTPDLLKKLGVPEGKSAQLFRKGGQVIIKNKQETCPVCSGGGYLGQEGVFEVYQFGDEERAALEQANFTGLKAAIRKKQLPGLGDAARAKVIRGTTSVDEMTRVFAPAAAAKPAPQAAPAAAAPAKPA